MADSNPKMLCVDSDADVLKSIQRSLDAIDIEVLTALSGKEGLEILRAQEVDLVMSDMHLSEMGGAEFLKAAAELQPHARRIVMCGQADAEEAKSAINDGGVSQFIDKPWDDVELRQVIDDAFKVSRLERENSTLNEVTQRQNEDLQQLNEELEDRVERRTEALERANSLLANTLRELEETQELMVDLVANIAALPKPESENSWRKLKLSLAIGDEFEMDDEELLHLKYATRLHKLGWVGVPKRLANKPIAKMSAEERVVYEKHPAYAEAVLLSVPYLKQASIIVSHQHEQVGGQGFPHKSAGDGIPLAARILAVARDYYDYINGRMEAGKLTPAESIARIKEGEGVVYDEAVVKVFLNVVKTIDELDPYVDEVSVRTMLLRPGMRLARGLATNEGVVLLAKGTTLTEHTIETLINLERRSDQELRIFVLKEEAAEESKKEK